MTKLNTSLTTALFFVLSTITSLQAEADIIYALSDSAGANSVFGTVRTDGTIGLLGPANFLESNAFATDGITTVALPDFDFGSINAVTATSTTLSLDFNSSFFQVENIALGATNNRYSNGQGRFNSTIVVDGNSQLSVHPDQFVFATQVPEPSSLALVGLAAVGVGIVHRRKRKAAKSQAQ